MLNDGVYNVVGYSAYDSRGSRVHLCLDRKSSVFISEDARVDYF